MKKPRQRSSSESTPRKSFISWESRAAPCQELQTDEDRAIYALGHHLATKVPPRTLTSEEIDTLVSGFRASLAGKQAAFELAGYVPMALNLLQLREIEMAKKAIFEGEQMLADAEAKPGAIRTPGGAVLVLEREGSGQKPNAFDTVEVHYEGVEARDRPRDRRD